MQLLLKGEPGQRSLVKSSLSVLWRLLYITKGRFYQVRGHWLSHPSVCCGGCYILLREDFTRSEVTG